MFATKKKSYNNNWKNILLWTSYFDFLKALFSSLEFVVLVFFNHTFITGF